MTIIPLSEGAFTIDNTKVFVPFNIGSDELAKRPAGSLLVEIQPFAIITGNDILLLDTGLGFADSSGTLQVHNNLAVHGINPLDVTKVLLSHLHIDHSGGISNYDYSMGKKTPAFPNATFYVNKKEFDFAMSKGNLSYVTNDFDFLSQMHNVVFTEDDGIIDNYISYKVTGAHSPYHQVFFIKQEDKIIFFGGDDAPQLHQMKSRFVAKYDFDGKKSMELRKQWWEKGEVENWQFLFYHDIKTPVFQK
jgi:glyoxylase-like metal-dependent hydrolase (beta-lactamase superfamily II)